MTIPDKEYDYQMKELVNNINRLLNELITSTSMYVPHELQSQYSQDLRMLDYYMGILTTRILGG